MIKNLNKCIGRIDITATPNKIDFNIYDFIMEYNQKVQTDYNVNVGFMFPPPQDVGPPEFLAMIRTTNNSIKWLGLALYGTMLNNLLLLSWPHPTGGYILSSPRWTE